MTFCANKKSPWRRFFFILGPLVGPFAAIRPSPSPCRCFVLMGIAWWLGVLVFGRGQIRRRMEEKKNPFGSDVGPSPSTKPVQRTGMKRRARNGGQSRPSWTRFNVQFCGLSY
ncbi:hypothetical protein CI102_2629 [Trichoderma harzianum]|nr:hypothetical protein CI102_2629 [Trichoderma harzianum]